MVIKKLCIAYPQLMFYLLHPFEKNSWIYKEIYKQFLSTAHPFLVSSMEKFYENISYLLVNQLFLTIINQKQKKG